MSDTVVLDGGASAREAKTPDAARSSAFAVVSVAVIGGLLLLARALPGSGLYADGVRSVAAACAALSVPAGIGGIFRIGRWWGILGETAIRYGVGSVTLLAAAFAVFRLGGGIAETSMAALAALGLLGVIEVARIIRSGHLHLGRPRWTSVIGFVVAMSIALGAVAYWRRWSAPPLQPIWDGLLHLVIVNRIVDGQFSFLLGDYTSAFQLPAYLPSLHLRIALVETLTGVDGLRILWGGPFALMAGTAGGMYLLLRRTWPSDLGATVGAALTPFMQVVIKSPAPLIQMVPASEAVMVTPLVLGVLTSSDDNRTAWRRTALAVVLMLPIHFVHGALLVGLLVGTFLISRFHNHAVVRWAVGLASAGAAALYAFPTSIQRRIPNLLFDPTGRYTDFTPSAGMSARTGIVDVYFPGSLVAIATVVTAAIIIVRRKQRVVVLAAFSFVALVAYWIPVITLERIHAFLLVAVGIAVAAAIDEIESFAGRHVARPARIWVAVVLIVVIGFGAFVSFDSLTEPLRTMRTRQLTDTDFLTKATSIAPYETEGIARYAAEYGTDLVAVSDPIGQSTLEAFGGFRTIDGPYLPEELSGNLRTVLTNSDSRAVKDALAGIEQIAGRPFLLMVTGRSYHWAYRKAGPFASEFRPRMLSLLPRGRVPRSAEEALTSLQSSGCVRAFTDYGEIVFAVIKCEANGD